MFPSGVIVFLCVFVGLQECLAQDDTIKELLDLDWKCTAVCTVSGGIAEFDLKDKTCICTVDQTVDVAQRAKIIKDAEQVGLHLLLNDGFERQLVKREVGASPQPQDHFVGQRTPNRIVTPKSRQPMRFPSSSSRPAIRWTTPRAITPIRRITPPRRNMDMHQRLEEIQKRINDRRRSRARSSTGPHLQLRSGFESSSQPNLMERLREMQKGIHERRIVTTPTQSTAEPSVAAPAPKPDTSAHTPPILRASHNNAGSATNEKTKEENHHAEIITQDPSLYKDDNKL